MTRTRPPQPQVSVIVPVYNQEQYLEECISSIRRQTLAEWECIIVNDGSSDSSGEIARRFSEEDSRIRCFEQENRGVSSARNLGMRHASGRYLCFVDGDDFIDAAFLKHLLDASDRGASDLTVAGKLFCDRFPPDKIPALPTCGIFLRREFPLKNNLEFPEGIHPCEDGLFSHFVLALTEKISFCPEAVYHYRQHEQGNHHQIRKRTADILPMIPSGPRVPGRENSRTAPAPSLRPAGTAKGTGMPEKPPRTMKRTNERKPPNYFPCGEKRLPPAKIPAPAFKDFRRPLLQITDIPFPA